MAMVLIFSTALFSCRGVKEVIREVPVEVPVIREVETHDTTIVERYRTIETKGDSVIVHDSIDRIVKVVEKTHDTVPVLVPTPPPPPEVVEVEKQLSWWTQTLIRIGWVAVIGGLLFAAYKFIRWRLKRK